MRQETKFGYGFCLVGAGVPFLIEHVFGLACAIVLSVVCIVAGGTFILAGHRHKDGQTRPKKLWEVLAFGAALFTLVVLMSIAALRFMPKKQDLQIAAKSLTTPNGIAQNTPADSKTAIAQPPPSANITPHTTKKRSAAPRPSDSHPVVVNGKGAEWESTCDTVNAAPNQTAIDNNGKFASQGLQVNPYSPKPCAVDPTTWAIQGLIKSSALPHLDEARWTGQVARILSHDLNEETVREFLAQPNLVEKRNFLQHLADQRNSH